jgi:membrane protease subunit (stomatin/prohibitin family)
MWNIDTSAMQNYTTTRQLDALEKAAENEWAAGAMMGAVVGMNMWQTMWNAIVWWTESNNDSVESKLEKLKNLLDKGLITKEDYEAKKKEILDNL